MITHFVGMNAAGNKEIKRLPTIWVGFNLRLIVTRRCWCFTNIIVVWVSRIKHVPTNVGTALMRLKIAALRL